MPPEARIPNSHARFVSIAEGLILKLRVIQDLATEGAWENLDSLTTPFLAEMEALRSFQKLPIYEAADCRLIEEVQQMLKATIALCSTRMEQIGPLLNALKITQTSTEAP